MGEVFSAPHAPQRAQSPRRDPTSAPPTHERTEGERPLSRPRSRRASSTTSAGTTNSMKLAHMPIASAPHPVQPSTEPDRRGQPDVAEAHARPTARTTAPRRTTGRAPSRRGRARAPQRSPVARPTTVTTTIAARVTGSDDDAGQQAGVPVDHRQGDRDRGQRHQHSSGQSEPSGRAEQRRRRPTAARCATRARPGGDVGVEHLGGLVGLGGWRRSAPPPAPPRPRAPGIARDQPRDQQAAQPGRSTAATSAASAGSVRVSVTGSFNRHGAPQGRVRRASHQHVDRRPSVR